MAGSVDLFLNISNGLDENLKASEKSLSGMNDIASKVNKNMTEMNKSSNMLNDNYDDIVENSEKSAKSTDKLAGALSKAVGFAKKLGAAMLLGFGAFGVTEVIQNTFKLNQEMANLSHRMGESGKTAHQLEKAVTGVTIATGASIDASITWITGLREMRVATKDLQELATVGYRFSKITGASEENTKNLIGSLNTMGGMGTKAIKGILREMVAVQKAFGFSQAEMDSLTESITKSSKTLRTMGKSAAEVAKFSSGVSKLAGAFASVGLNAETALGFIDKLLDPGAIEDNALLYAKLGVSMQDAMEGNVDPAKLIGGFKDLGKELKGMSNFAANELAKSLGMPLNELRQMAEMDESELNKALGGTLEISEDLKIEQDRQAKAQEDMAAASEKLKAVFIDIALKAMPVINKLTGWVNDNIEGWLEKGKMFAEKIGAFFKKFTGGDLKKMGLLLAGAVLGVIFLFTRMRKKFASVSTDMGKDLSEAISSGMNEAMDMGSQKAASKFEERMKAGTNAYMADLQARILEGTDYAATQAASNFYKTMGGTKLTKGAKALAEHAGEYLDRISAGAKPASLLEKIAEKSNNRTKERIRLERESSTIAEGAIKGARDLAEADNKRFTDRIKQLEKEDKLSPARQAELQKLQKLQEKSTNLIMKQTDELENIKSKADARELSALKNISKEEKVRMKNAIQDEITRGMEEVKNNKRFQEHNKVSIGALENSQRALEEELHIQDKKIKNGELNNEQLIEANAKRLEIIEQQKNTNELMSQELETRDRLALIEKEAEEALKKNNAQLMIMINSGANITKQDLDRMEINKKNLIQQAEGLDKQSKGYKDIQNELREIEKLTEGSLAGVDGEILVKTFGEKIKGTFEAVKNNFVGGIKDGLNTARDSISVAFKAGKEIINPKNWKKAISAAGDGSFFKGLAKGMKKGASVIAGGISKAGKAAGKAMSTIGKGIGGPLLLLGGLFIGAMKNMDGFKTVIEKVKDVFKSLMDKLMPIIEQYILPLFLNLINALMPLVDMIGQMLGPILASLGGVMEALMPIVIELVKTMLPPILLVLGYLLKIIGFLITTIGDLIQTFADYGKKATDKEQALIDSIKGIGEGMTSASATLIDTGKIMMEANKDSDFGIVPEYKLPETTVSTLESVAKSSTAISDNTDPEREEVTTTLYPAIIKATGEGFVKTEDARKTMSGSPEAIQEALAREQLEVDKERNRLLEEANSLNAATASATTEMRDKPISTRNAELSG